MARMKITDLPKNMRIHRSELKTILGGATKSTGDTHDRYTNIEASYLRERLERHDDMAILVSNVVK